MASSRLPHAGFMKPVFVVHLPCFAGITMIIEDTRSAEMGGWAVYPPSPLLPSNQVHWDCT